MLDKIKDKLTSIVLDYILNQLFNTIFLPILSLLMPMVTLLLLGLINQAKTNNIPTWEVIVFLIIYFVSGVLIGWRVRTAWLIQTDKLNNQIETRVFRVFYNFEKGRIPAYAEIYRKVYSRRTRPLRHMEIMAGYFASSGYKNIKVKALDYGVIEDPRPTRLRRLKMNFVFDHELQPGGTAEMKYRVDVTNRKEEPPPYYMVKAVYGPIKEAHISVRFDPNSMPRRVWRAKWSDDVGVEPELIGEPLQPTRGTTYETVFRNLPGGLNLEYGIYWDW